MSIRVTRWVWDHSALTGTHLLAALALADFANDQGVAFPSVARLADKARLSKRRTQQILLDMERVGEVAIDKATGPYGCNVYRFTSDLEGVQSAAPPMQSAAPPMQCASPVQPVAPVQSSVKGGAIQSQRGCNPESFSIPWISPNPSLEPPRTIIEPPTISPTRSRKSAAAHKAERDKTPSHSARGVVKSRINGNDHEHGNGLELGPIIERIPLVDGTEFAVHQGFLAELERAYPALDGPGTLREIRAWCLSNEKDCKTRRGVKRFINSWFARQQDRAPR